MAAGHAWGRPPSARRGGRFPQGVLGPGAWADAASQPRARGHELPSTPQLPQGALTRQPAAADRHNNGNGEAGMGTILVYYMSWCILSYFAWMLYTFPVVTQTNFHTFSSIRPRLW